MNPLGKIREGILKLSRERPDLRAKEIADVLNTTPGYVYKVRSEAKKRRKAPKKSRVKVIGESYPWRDSGLTRPHGGAYWFVRENLPPSWYEDLDLPVVNEHSGLKQLGYRDAGDPCSFRVWRTGRVVVYPHRSGWRAWLKRVLPEKGWDGEKAALVADNLDYSWKDVHVPVKLPEEFLPPMGSRAEGPQGVVRIVRDLSDPDKLEIMLNLCRLEEVLGVRELAQTVEVLSKGQQAAFQRMVEMENRFIVLMQAFADALGIKNGKREPPVVKEPGQQTFKMEKKPQDRLVQEAPSAACNRTELVPSCQWKGCRFDCPLWRFT